MPQKEVMFKSKHKLDLGNVSFEQRGKDLFGYNETEFSSKGIYDLVHPEDLSYVAQAHSECKSILDLYLTVALFIVLYHNLNCIQHPYIRCMSNRFYCQISIFLRSWQELQQSITQSNLSFPLICH